MTPTREQAAGFDDYWQARCLETWREMGCDKERGPTPSGDWGEGYKRAAQHAYAAARAHALEDAATVCGNISQMASSNAPMLCAEQIRALKGKQ